MTAEPAPVEPEPAKKATRSRKKAAPEAAGGDAVEPVKKATRSRKKAVAEPEAAEAAEPAPVKAVKKAAKRVAKAVKKDG